MPGVYGVITIMVKKECEISGKKRVVIKVLSVKRGRESRGKRRMLIKVLSVTSVFLFFLSFPP